MPYWLAKLLGRADGPAVARCAMCRASFAKADGLVVTGTAGLVCSKDCAEHAAESMAW